MLCLDVPGADVLQARGDRHITAIAQSSNGRQVMTSPGSMFRSGTLFVTRYIVVSSGSCSWLAGTDGTARCCMLLSRVLKVHGRERKLILFFAQVGAGFAHYALRSSVLGRVVDEHATNFALGLGAGLVLPLTRRLGMEAMPKDYIVSFKSIRDLAAFGIEGQRTHSVLLLLSGRFGL